MSSKSRPRLAIAVPTFNRAALLNELLWNIGPQVERLFPQCVCYIVDNDSPDNTAEVVRQHSERWRGIHYVKNEQNIGGLRNIAKAIEAPNSEWVWLLGDDDVPMPWGLQDLLAQITEIESRSPQAAFLLMSDVKLTGSKGRTLVQDPRFFATKAEEITIYENGAEIAEHGIHGIAWLSLLAIRQSAWDRGYFDSVVRDVDLYTHVRVLLYAAAKGQAAYTKRCYVYGTDLGSRQYYFSKTAIARVCEFPEIEQLVVNALGLSEARIALRPGRKGWLRERGAYAAKIGVFREQYAAQLKYVRAPLSPFWEERLLVRFAYWATSIPMVRTLLARLYFRSRGERAESKLTIGL